MKRSAPISANGCLKTLRSDPDNTPVPERPSRHRRLILFWLPVALYCGALLLESSMPTSSDPRLFHHEDKLLHLAACGIMACLFARALKGSAPSLPSGTLKWLTLVFVCLFGLGEETYQFFIPTRTPSLGDLTADISGALLGTWFYLDIFRGGK